VEPDISSVSEKSYFLYKTHVPGTKFYTDHVSHKPTTYCCTFVIWKFEMLNEWWDTDSALKGGGGGVVPLVWEQAQYSFPLFYVSLAFSELLLRTHHYVLSLAALNSLITFSYTTNVREAAGRFFSRLDVMPL
jgi:hypothetical protein